MSIPKPNYQWRLQKCNYKWDCWNSYDLDTSSPKYEIILNFHEIVSWFWSFLEQKKLLTSSDEFVHGRFVSNGSNHLNLIYF